MRNMRILHYFLGFPPYRSGGMTIFAFDLMKAQSEEHQVMALWPGRMQFVTKSPAIKKRKSIGEIENFELINPLPIPLDEGICEPKIFMESCDRKIFENFLKQVNVNMIHIHTLMGLYKEFLDVAQELGIRTVFTTHDYFGICPKVHMFKDGKSCEDCGDCEKCVECNVNGLPLWKIQLMQSGIYKDFKDSYIMKIMRRRHRARIFNENESGWNPVKSNEKVKAEEYRKLRSYYITMLQSISVFHFNSTVARDVYLRFIKPKTWRIISITHEAIADHRDEMKWKQQDRLRITYLGPLRELKGFYFLKKALDELWATGNHNFILNVFASVQNPSPYMVVKPDGYTINELKAIFEETDIMAAPSIWYETFGFTVLEAISYGVPVIISDHVGAKDILNDAGIIVKAGDVAELKSRINNITRCFLIEKRRQIACLEPIKTMKDLCQEMESLYN